MRAAIAARTNLVKPSSRRRSTEEAVDSFEPPLKRSTGQAHKPKISVATSAWFREAPSDKNSSVEEAFTEAIRQISHDLKGRADLVLCFLSDDTLLPDKAKEHPLALALPAVLKCAPGLVGDVPFAAGTTNGLQAGLRGGNEFYGYGGSALCVWALRDPGGAFAVGGCKGAPNAPYDVGKEAAKDAKAALESELVRLHAKIDEEKLLIWLMTTPGNEEQVLEGVRASVPWRARLLGASSADENPADVDDHSWQCIGGARGTNEFGKSCKGGVVVVMMHPSVDFACVFGHGFEKEAEGSRHRATIIKVSQSGEGGSGGTEGGSRTIEMLLDEAPFVKHAMEQSDVISRFAKADAARRSGKAELAHRLYLEARARRDEISEKERKKALEEKQPGKLAAEVYDDWLLQAKGVAKRGGESKGGIIRQLRDEAKPGCAKSVLEHTTSYPLSILPRTASASGTTKAAQSSANPAGLHERPLLHPSAVTSSGHLQTFAEVQQLDRIELLTANGTTLLYSIAILDELIDAAKERATVPGVEPLGSLCFFCAGCKAAVLSDPDVDDGMHALQTAFGGATNGQPFVLVHPFGEQGCAELPPKQEDEPPLKSLGHHSNLNFGSVVFFAPPADSTEPPAEQQSATHSQKRGGGSALCCSPAPSEVVEMPSAVAPEMSMRSEEMLSNLATGCFWFVHRDCLLSATTRTLERFQDLLRRYDHSSPAERARLLKPVRIDESADEWMVALQLRELVGTHCAVSHRWNRPNDPDPKGRQLRAIQNWLVNTEMATGVQIEWIWYD